MRAENGEHIIAEMRAYAQSQDISSECRRTCANLPHLHHRASPRFARDIQIVALIRPATVRRNNKINTVLYCIRHRTERQRAQSSASAASAFFRTLSAITGRTFICNLVQLNRTCAPTQVSVRWPVVGRGERVHTRPVVVILFDLPCCKRARARITCAHAHRRIEQCKLLSIIASARTDL